MSYQGVLTDGTGAPVADGSHSLVFKLYNVSTGGSALWTETQGSVNTTNGVLGVELGSVTPIGIAFDGALWLGIAVDGGAELTPRIELTTSPYAFTAGDVDDGKVVKSLNTLTDDVTLDAGSNVTITPSGNMLTIASSAAGGNNLDMAYDEGGAGVGRTITADNGAVQIQGADGLHVNTGSILADGTVGTTPASGAGTRLMWIPAKGAFRAGKVTGTDWDDANVGVSSTITGGEDNAASGAHATVGGGINNAASGQHGTVVGGEGSLAGGISSTVAGGKDNEATGNYSFAAGQRAKANHNGAFVWADQTAADFASTAVDQFLIRAAGGVGIGTTAPTQALHVVGAMYGTGNLTLDAGTSLSLSPSGTISMNGNPLVMSRTSSGSLTITSDITLSPEAAASALVAKMTSGNIGIGTTTPSEKLEVSGGAIIASGFANRAAATGPALEIGYDGSKTVLQSYDRTTASHIPASYHASEHQFYIGAAEKARIDANGHLGIGTTAPRVLLDIVKAGTGSGQILEVGSLSFYKDSTPTKAADIGLYPVGGGLTDDLVFSMFDGASWFERMRIANGGNVGIGTASPGQLLDLNNAGSAGTVYPLRLVNNTTAVAGTGVGIEFGFQAGTQILSTIEAKHTGGSQTDLIFSTQNGAVNESMRILGNGKVAIGTTTPFTQLDIVGDPNGAVRITSTEADVTAKALSLVMPEYTNANGHMLVVNGQTNVTDNVVRVGGGWSGYDAATVILFYTAAALDTDVGSERMRIDLNGNVGIGTTVPTQKLHVAGNVAPVSDNTNSLGTAALRWTDVFAVSGSVNASDRRLKENIEDSPYGLKEVMDLHPVSYTWKDRPERGPKLGLIAQEVQPVISEVVHVGDDPDETLGLYYSDLVPVLIKAIQEQQEHIEEQTSEKAELQIQLERTRTELRETRSTMGSELDEMRSEVRQLASVIEMVTSSMARNSDDGQRELLANAVRNN